MLPSIFNLQNSMLRNVTPAPAGSGNSPQMLKMAEDYIRNSRANPPQANPAYSWAQLAGNILQSLAGAKLQGDLSNATANTPTMTGMPGAPDASGYSQAVQSQPPLGPQSIDPNSQSFIKENPQANNAGMNDIDKSAMMHLGMPENAVTDQGQGHSIAEIPQIQDQDEYAHTTGLIENGGRLSDGATGSNRGLYQFGRREEAEYGINDANRNTYEVQRRALDMETAKNVATFEKVMGRTPTNPEKYIMHQQGLAGGLALFTNPNISAVDAISSFYKPGIAILAIQGNIPRDTVLHGVDPSKITSQQFIDMWKAKYATISKHSGTQVASASVAGVMPGEEPAETGSIDKRAQAAQNGTSDLSSGPYSVVPPNLGLSPQEMSAVMSYPPDAQKMILENRMRLYQPQIVKTPQGEMWFRPIDGAHGFVGQPIPSPIHAGDIGMTGQSYFTGPNGKLETQYPSMGPNGQSGNAADTLKTLGRMGQTQGMIKNQTEQLGKEDEAINNMAKSLPDARATLGSLRTAIQDRHFFAGGPGEYVKDFKSYLAMVPGYEGVNKSTEVFEKMTARNALNQIKEYFNNAGLGRVLQKEVDFVDKMNGNIKTTKEGLLAINDVNSKYLDFAEKFINAEQQYKAGHGGLLDGDWMNFRNKWLAENRPFSDEDMKGILKTVAGSDPNNMKTLQDTFGLSPDKSAPKGKKLIWKNNRAVYE